MSGFFLIIKSKSKHLTSTYTHRKELLFRGMETNYHESLILEDKPITIRQYATYVLSHPEIKRALEKIKTYQQTADRLIDSLHGMMDTETFPIIIYSEEEIVCLGDVVKDMESLKKTALERIMEPIKPNFTITHPGKEGGLGASTRATLHGFMRERNSSTLAHLSLSVFKQFTMTPGFSDYLTTGAIPFISPPTSPMAPQIEMQTVFSLFIWVVMYHKDEESFNFSSKHGDNHYMTLHRPTFLTKFKEQIRLDGEGSISLVFDDPLWGRIRIKDHPTQDPLSLTSETLAILRGNPLTYSSMACKCCNAPLLAIWLSDKKERIPFCNSDCETQFIKEYIK